ncbi:MAG TPA: FtsX-like permease family protein [Myxococcaceae bacterium]|nr:FtsX-like permease family protein [Myxococcaceae bacterium]
MRPLDRKVLRDAWRLRAQGGSIALVICCGAAVFLGSAGTTAALQRALDDYYVRYQFADVFARLKRAPEPVGDRLRAIPGVGQVETRIVRDVSIDVPGLDEPATARLVSIPDPGPPVLNRLHLKSGRWPEPGRDAEVLVNQAFAEADHLAPGAELVARINGRRQRLHVVGVALSPEYVYQLQEGAVFPDDRRFGVVWMPREGLASAFDLRGAFDDVVLRLGPGASAPAVISEVDRLLDRYGSLGAYGRSQHTSHKLVTNEFQQLGVMATIIPAIFLLVSAFLVNLVFSRLLDTERDQIAALKALGYMNGTIGLHYAKLVGLIILIGLAGGLVVGDYFGTLLTGLYTGYFRFPLLRYRLEGPQVLLVSSLSLAAAAVGAWSSLHRATSLPPAEALRPPAPADYHPSVIERAGLGRMLGVNGRFVLRQLARQPGRAFLSSLAFGLALSIVVVTVAMFAAMDVLLLQAMPAAQREDLKVGLVSSLGADEVLAELRAFPGVLGAEVVRAAPVRLRNGHLWRDVALSGVSPASQLRRLVNLRMAPRPLPADGMVLTSTLAEVLRVRAGDTLEVHLLTGDRRTGLLPVTGVVDEPVGFGATMAAEALARWLGERPLADMALVEIDEAQASPFLVRTKEVPKVTSAIQQKTLIALFQEMMKRTMWVDLVFLGGFAGALAFSIVYNDARIALSERARELATLRVIGFTHAEVARLLFAGLAVEVLLGLPVGALLGTWLGQTLAPFFENENVRFNIPTTARNLAESSLFILGAAVLSAAAVNWRIGRLDLISVLKTRE